MVHERSYGRAGLEVERPENAGTAICDYDHGSGRSDLRVDLR